MRRVLFGLIRLGSTGVGLEVGGGVGSNGCSIMIMGVG